MNDFFTEDEKKSMLSMARLVIAGHLSGKEAAYSFPEKLSKKGSCFVSLHTKDGNLRGCIGNIEAFELLGENIIHNAINSAFQDPRFRPVQSLAELSSLTIEISVMTAPKKINSPGDFIVGQHGIILMKDGASAVFLPQVAPEQGWNRESTLEHLSMKAGLLPDAWREPDAKFKVFEAIVFSENEK